MPGIARQFEPQITRSGGAPSKFRFTVRCSECARADTYETSRSTSNDAVKGYFKDRGWLLGRASSFDVCPACLAQPRHTHETKSAASRREPGTSEKRYQNTADILARHLGKTEDLAAEVFRPKEAKSPQPSAPKASQPMHPTPVLSPEVEQALAGMAADLKGLRAAAEIMVDQVGKLVALGGRQIEAIAHLAPALLQSTEGLSGSLRQIASAVQTVPHPPVPAVDVQLPPETASDKGQTRAGDPERAAAPVSEVQPSAGQPRVKRVAKGRTVQTASAPVAVRSIADSKRSDRYYTSIRLPRELWDQAGFGPDDKLLLAWSGKALTIERAMEGGVKPKAVGDTSVVLQSWKLGNLNFDQPKIAGANGSLRLTAGRRSPEA
ncbi:hypothetical protein [Microvirga sp. VF16]|uniref:hypothetical protein n=1 Tax=Microvirga sp. VF16 TaxID=2807101 RepID=UPI00193E012F|nr:hypothetical protein [Microvirga sp. VF16]QRM35866.1 hypothetical protein JO965_46615 [Microvirga sp. VF16]